VDAVVSFHGEPTLPSEADLSRLQATVMVCHGADDPLVPQERVRAFQKTMRESARPVDWVWINYGGAVHSFTNPGADGSFHPGVKYDATAAKRSWSHMKALFEQKWG
jgi:dienelactone hydrolase